MAERFNRGDRIQRQTCVMLPNWEKKFILSIFCIVRKITEAVGNCYWKYQSRCNRQCLLNVSHLTIGSKSEPEFNKMSSFINK